MKTLLYLSLALLFPLQPLAADKPEVMLIGTFHFKDAGLDVVKQKDIDIFTAESQQYLQDFTQRLAAFEADRVMLEYHPENDELLNQRYRDYLAGNYELPANEIYQLGFRIAKMSGHSRIYTFDYREVEWRAEAMFEYAEKHDSPEMRTFNRMIEEHTAESERARETLPLGELLKRANDPEQDRRNMDLYMATNAIGAGDGYPGAIASASWWERNFYMYANVQKMARNSERIIAIGGAGHMAIIKQFLAIDSELQGVAVAPYF